MKLSEAMELGSTIEGTWHDGSTAGACAMQAASLAVKGTKNFAGISNTHWTWLREYGQLKEACKCKIGDTPGYPLWGGSTPINQIIHVFNTHVAGIYGIQRITMNFDQFLDWIRSVEPAEPQEAVIKEPVGELVHDSN